MPIKMNMSDLPEKSTFDPIEEGIYYIEITDVVEDKTKDGGDKIMMAHDIINTGRKINYDNYVISNADGTNNNFGRRKLRKIVEAAEIDVEEITVPILRQFLIGKIIKAEIKNNEKDFPQIHFDEFYPKDSLKETINSLEKQEDKPIDYQTPATSEIPEGEMDSLFDIDEE